MGLVEMLLKATIEHEHGRQNGVEDNRYAFSQEEETRDGVVINGKADFSKGLRELDYVLEFGFLPEPDFRNFNNSDGYSMTQLEEVGLMLRAFGVGTRIKLDSTNPCTFFSTITLNRGHKTKDHITFNKSGFSIRLSLEEVDRLEEPTEYEHVRKGLSELIDFYVNYTSENRNL